MKAAEMRDKSPEELKSLEAELREELFELRMQHHTGQLESPARIRETRRTIARVLTVRGELERSASE
jgi:large subunit ribosomal protein L29